MVYPEYKKYMRVVRSDEYVDDTAETPSRNSGDEKPKELERPRQCQPSV